MTYNCKWRFNLIQKKAPWSFSIQIILILSKLHLNVIYKFIHGIEGHLVVMVKGR
jgi:hypothetical protein